MRFDSHLLAVMRTAVGLVNALTAGHSGGRTIAAPVGRDRVRAVQTVLTRPGGAAPQISEPQAHALAAVAATLRRVFVAVDGGDLASAAGLVNRLLRESGARPQLDHDPADGWNLHFHGVDDSIVAGWTAGCASGMALALGSDLAGRLGVCAAARCDRVYVDASRNGARRFCSTACQNRTKAAAFRARGVREPGAVSER
jgi:predicted RNA-binding Zn ribbon-like protein